MNVSVNPSKLTVNSWGPTFVESNSVVIIPSSKSTVSPISPLAIIFVTIPPVKSKSSPFW